MILTLIITVVAVIVGVISCKYLGNDNPIEELCEDFIKIETGEDVDLNIKEIVLTQEIDHKKSGE